MLGVDPEYVNFPSDYSRVNILRVVAVTGVFKSTSSCNLKLTL